MKTTDFSQSSAAAVRGGQHVSSPSGELMQGSGCLSLLTVGGWVGTPKAPFCGSFPIPGEEYPPVSGLVSRTFSGPGGWLFLGAASWGNGKNCGMHGWPPGCLFSASSSL